MFWSKREKNIWKRIRVTVTLAHEERRFRDFGGRLRRTQSSHQDLPQGNEAHRSEREMQPFLSPSYSCIRQALRVPGHKKGRFPVDPHVLLRGGTETESKPWTLPATYCLGGSRHAP